MLIGIAGFTYRKSSFDVVNGYLGRAFRRLGHRVRVCRRRSWQIYRYTEGLPRPAFWTACNWKVENLLGTRGLYIPYVVNEVSEVWSPNLEAASLSPGIVATCSFVKDTYNSAGYGKVATALCGVDHAMYHPDVPPVRIPTKKRFKFMMLQVLNTRSGADIAIRAYAKAFTAKDDVCLVLKDFMVYPGIRSMIEKELAAQKDPPEILYTSGSFDGEHHAGWYTACDVFLYPTRGSAPGLTALEAMACGRPVIGNTWSGLSDYLDDSNGWTLQYELWPILPKLRILDRQGFPSWVEQRDYVREPVFWAESDVDDLARKMRQAYEEPNLLARKAVLAYKSVLPMTWEHTARQFLEAIRQLGIH